MSSANEINERVGEPENDVEKHDGSLYEHIHSENERTSPDTSNKNVRGIRNGSEYTNTIIENVDSSELRPVGSDNSEPVDMDIDNQSDSVALETKESTVPIIKITFRDDEIEKTYKASLLKFFCQKIPSCTVLQNSESRLQFDIYVEEGESALDDEFLDFHLDTTPFSSHCNKVPTYGRNHNIILGDANSEQSTSSQLLTESPAPICFNCCGNHLLRDCPHDRDIKEIKRNRSKCQSTNKSQRSSRYHLNENQKFSNLVPGKLSEKLRNALDLRKDQQPLFIYRMRVLGYPPAWLEEARVPHSGVTIYDSTGAQSLEEDEEEREIVSIGAKDRFDISKIVEYPGFNVPLPKNMKEEGKAHCCPAISEAQSKENLIKSLEPTAVQAYKKRSLSLQRSYVEDGISSTDEKRASSPTIEEMEEKKRQLLIELQFEEASTEHKLMENDITAVISEETEESGVNTETSVEDIVNVKNLDFATPVRKSVSPYSKLPSREQFSVNISDVINFENMPNATGKYETMSNLIHKIRDTVSRIQNQ